MDADELVRRYEAGERAITRVKLSQAVLIEASLEGARPSFGNLGEASLGSTNLAGTSLTEALLYTGNLRRTDLKPN